MNKLTPQLFSELPEEMQQDILQNVPASHLNEIAVINVAECDPIAAMKDIQEMLHSLTRKEALTTIVELVASISSKLTPKGVPMETVPTVQWEILSQAVKQARAALKEIGDEDDG